MRLQCLLAVLAAASATGQEYLLPRAVWPVHTSWASSTALNQLKVKTATSKIVLHAQDFIIPPKGIQFVDDRNAPEVKSFNINDTFNFLTIELDRDLKAGEKYTLNIPFYGHLTTDLHGAYIDSYIDRATNNTEYLIATHFEPILGRKAFPCFDEPIFKAKFEINIGHQKEYRAVSNMALIKSTTDNLLDGIWSWDNIEGVFEQGNEGHDISGYKGAIDAVHNATNPIL